MEDQTVSGPELADWLGVSPTRVQQLAQSNHVAKHSRGKYWLKKSIQLYTGFLRDSSQGRQQPEEKAQYEEERAKLYRVRRMKAEAEYNLYIGKLHDGEIVEKLWNDQTENCKSKLRTIKTKLSPLVQYEDQIPVIESIIGDEIDAALEELSNYDQTKFIEESIAALALDGDGLQAAAEMED